MDCVVIHISDLHIKASNSRRVTGHSRIQMSGLASSIEIALAAYPSHLFKRFLAITGDIVDSPSDVNSIEAEGLIDELCGCLGIPHNQVVYVHGNHDAKIDGFRAARIPYSYKYCKELYDKQCSVSIVGFDSTSGLLARGALSRDSYKEALNALETHMKMGAHSERETEEPVLAIALVHHHPLPIKAGEQSTVLGKLQQEQFLQMDNAGAFLEACIEHQFDIILHGHRHVSKFHQYSVMSDGGKWKSILILASASSTGAEESMPGFNLIIRKHALPVAEVIRLATNAKFQDLRDLDPDVNLTFTIENEMYENEVGYRANLIHFSSGAIKASHQLIQLKLIFEKIHIPGPTDQTFLEYLFFYQSITFYWVSVIKHCLFEEWSKFADLHLIESKLMHGLNKLSREIALPYRDSELYALLLKQRYKTSAIMRAQIADIIDDAMIDSKILSAFIKSMPDFLSFIAECDLASKKMSVQKPVSMPMGVA